MKLGELLKKVDIVEAGAFMDNEICGVCFDSRKLLPGELFVAIRGYESDGHAFINDAMRKGAACIVCEEKPEAAGGTCIAVPYVIVNDSRVALALVSAAWFGMPADKLKIIGVTGTNGKTTVTTLIKQVLERCSGSKVGLIGTNGVLIGSRELPAERTTPESFEIHRLLAEMLRDGCEYVVMEVSSHALYLKRVFGIEFEVGVFTNLSQDHQDFHDSMEEYALVKSKLFSACRSAAINIDDEHAPVMMEHALCKRLTYAIKDDAADLVAKNVKLHSDSVDFSALSIGSLNRVVLGIPGMFSIYNALAVIAAAMLLGFDAELSASALRTCCGVKGRAEVVPTGGDYSVLIDYAHTPDALENIITAARGFSNGRVVTLFGCGGDRDKLKRPVMGRIAAEFSDFVIVTSDNPRTEEPSAIINEILAGMDGTATPYIVIENRREAIYWALDNAQPDDVLILAGKGHEAYQIFGKEKRHFDEREVVAEHLGGSRL
ncbi:MAG: UDP-N-acetylmuramoyl-L-alanyl-D-glutamate--2,6-diaminopimelate ligase [Oscillospiraceae bacterium]|nr:UDP-N-acetylmuramoyl-L-alanyl-D-glutamate--2,6-diaminopimelate ligase [Oscillospiraceae bacterium]